MLTATQTTLPLPALDGKYFESNSVLAKARNQKSVLGIAWALNDFIVAFLGGLSALLVRGGSAAGFWHRMVVMHGFDAETWFLAGFAIIFPVYLVGTGRVLGLYRSVHAKTYLNEQRITCQTVVTAALLICGTLFLTRTLYASRSVLAFTVFNTAVILMLERVIWRTLRERRCRAGLEIRNALIVGDGKMATAFRNHLLALPHYGFRFKGFITTGRMAESEVDTEVIGEISNCVTLARSLFVDEIYFASKTERDVVEQVVAESRAYGIEVRVVPDMYDGLAWNAPVEFVGQFPTILLHHHDLPCEAILVKRLLDLVASFLGIAVLSPLLVLIALAVKLDSPGPVFYGAARIGRKGRKFRCFKFRTMVANADQLRDSLAHLNERNDILFKIAKDPRVTRVGYWLRKYSLDELPQLFNVLMGNMSLVGPRPPIASEVARYEIVHLRRLDVLPGITGLWQVEAREDPSFDSYISLDVAYVDNWSLLMDLRILARTLFVVFRGTGC